MTVLTALFVYFGYLRTSTFYSYFGIAAGHLQLSTQDYVLRSADVSAGVMVRLVAIGIVFFALNGLVSRVLKPQTRQRRHGRQPPGLRTSTAVPDRARGALRSRLPFWLVTGIGTFAVLCGLTVAVSSRAVDAVGPSAGAALLACGAVVLLRAGATAIPGSHPRLVTALLALILLVSAFWATSIYAVDMGTIAARNVDTQHSQLALVTMFNPDPLDLPGSEVQASRIPGPDGRTRYRYTGLRLLTYANDRWFVITGRLADGYRSSIVVLHDAPPLRVELAVPPEK